MSKVQPPRYRMNGLRNILTAKPPANSTRPPILKLTPKAEAYKGYSRSYIEVSVRTNVESDAGNNHGMIAVKIPSNDFEAALLWAEERSKKIDDTASVLELTCYETVWTKAGGRSDKPLLVGTFRIGCKGGIWRVALAKEGRPNIGFEFGAGPEHRNVYAQMVSEGLTQAEYSAACLRRWVSSILNDFSRDVELSIAESLEKDLEKTGGRQNDHQETRHINTSSVTNSPAQDDDLPF